jgi:transposase
LFQALDAMIGEGCAIFVGAIDARAAVFGTMSRGDALAVSESYAPGAVVLDAARRHDISPQHLFAWREAARAGLLSLPADECCCLLRSSRSLAAMDCAGASAGDRAAITIEIGGEVVRAARGVDPVWLRDVLRAVKAAT